MAETPSSTRRVTRSQSALKNINNNIIPISRKIEESEKGISKSMKRNGKQQQQQQQQDRSSGLTDVANDSPIVGLAAGALKTPSSNIMNKGVTKNRGNMTPGSGEALLRGQVKILLQKVEEEAEISKISSLRSPRFSNHYGGGVVNSPFALIAPTPANTPQIMNLSDDKICFGSSVSISSSIITQDDFKISQIVEQDECAESEKSFKITRSLLLDFTDSSSDVGYREDIEQGGDSNDENVEEHCADVIDEEVTSSVNELSSVMSTMSIATKWSGKHTRFVYDSDDEIKRVEEMMHDDDVEPTGGIRLNGLPTPKGKHIRFTEDDEM